MELHEQGHIAAESADRSARRLFHVALAAALFPYLSFIVSWTCFFVKRSYPNEIWRKRIGALAILDTLVFVAAVLLTVQFIELANVVVPAPAPAPDQPRIGLMFSDERSHRLRVVAVAPHSPASEAGFRVGDTILKIDETVPRHPRHVARIIGATPPDATRRVDVRRADGTLITIDVVPRKGVESASSVASEDLPAAFETESTSPDTIRALGTSSGLIALVMLMCGGVLFSWARIRGERDVVPLMVVVFGYAGMMALVYFCCSVLQENNLFSRGALMLVACGAAVFMGVIGAIGLYMKPSEPTVDLRSTLRSIGLGVFYLVTSVVRAGILLSAIWPFVSRFGIPSGPTDFSGSGMPLGVVLLFILLVVVIAPIAEEIVFRGVFVSWLRRFMTDTQAVVVSAAVFALAHLFYGLGILIVFCYGVVFAVVYIRTGRVYASTALHMLINASACAIAFLR